MLERLAASLLTALDGLATEELHLRAQQGFFWPRVYFPFIVTTAQLYVCRFKLADISLNDGTIPDGQIEPVPFTRFRKSLTTKSNSNLSPRNLGEANRDRERTVFVVQASEFIKVLKDWNPNFPPGKPPW